MRGDVAGNAGNAVGQRNGDLPAHVEAGIIVDAEPRIANAVANEDQRCVHGHLPGRDVRPDRCVLARRELHLAAIDRELDRWRSGQRCAAERDLDEPAAVRTARLQPELPELRSDIVGGDIVPARSGVPSLQKVARQEFDVGANAIGGMPVADRLRRRGANQQSGCDKAKQPLQSHAQFRLSSLRSHSSACVRIVSMSA